MASLRSRHTSSQKPPEEIFYDTSLAERFLTTANRMRKEEILTDITLICQDGKFPCHKFLLATNSDYFLALFNGPMATSDVNVNVFGLTSDVLDDILTYIYSGVICITEINIQDILYASSMFLLNNLKDRCAKFLNDRLDVGNCLQIFSLAKKFSLHELIDDALDFISVVFLDLSILQDFKELCVDELIDIISLDNLAIPSEDYVLEAAIAWLRNDPVQRQKQFVDVLNNLHLPFVSDLLMKQILDREEVVKCNEQLLAVLHSASKLTQKNWMLGEDHSKTQYPVAWCSPRKCTQCIPSIIAMGGPTLSLFNSELNKWCEIIKCKPRHCPGMDVLGTNIYIVGGSLEWKRKSSGEKYNTETNEWCAIESMLTPRSNFGLVEQKGKLYAMGGYDGNFPLKSAEVYDPKKDEWTSISNMNSARDGACSISDGERIYVVGGYDGKKYLTTTECYSTKTGHWDDKAVPSMTERRQNAMCAYYNSCVFIIGGYYDDVYHNSVEVLDLEANKWSFVSSLPEPRHHAGAAAMNGHVFVCGGWSGQLPVASVDVYSIDQDTWRRVAPLLTPTMVRCAAVSFPRKLMITLFPPNEEGTSKTRRSTRSSNSESSVGSLELSS